MVVINKSGINLQIPELRKIVPSDGKPYILPYEVAIKYKGYLTPVQLSDEIIPQPTKNENNQKQTTVEDLKKESVPEIIINTIEVEEINVEESTESDLKLLDIEEIDSTKNTIKDIIVPSKQKEKKPLAGKKISRAIREQAKSKK